MSMLALDVEKRLGEFFINVSFESTGGVTGLFGASGAGKTTLMNMIAGLIAPDRGRIALDHATLFDSASGIDVPAHRRRIGYVFQEGRLFPHLSVAANLDYGRRMQGLARDSVEIERIVASSISAICSSAGQAGFPAASASALRWGVRCSWVRASFFSMSRLRRSMRLASVRSCPIWKSCATRRACPWSVSPTMPPSLPVSPLPWSGWTPGGWRPSAGPSFWTLPISTPWSELRPSLEQGPRFVSCLFQLADNG